MCKQVLKYVKCELCASVITQKECGGPEAEITYLKSRGKLLHPNHYFFMLIRNVEDKFIKHINSPFVFQDIIDELIESHEFTFPCIEHKDDILAFSIRYYINLRMRQFTRQLNRENPKENLKKKKQAKFSTT